MKIFFLKIFLLIGLILISCNQNDTDKNKNLHYSISLGTFKNYNQASEFRFQFPNDIRAKIRYELISTKKYKVLIGNYRSSYDAGKEAFKLYREKKINKYEIVKDGQIVLDEFINVPFISFYLGKSAIFNYNLKTKIKELLLSFEKKEVALLSMTKNADKLFIINYEKQQNEMQIKNIELVLYERNSEEITKLLSMNNVNYIYTYWNKNDTLKTNIIKVDEKNPRKILQLIYGWNSSGNKIIEKQKKHDLLSVGYPTIEKRRMDKYSPNNRFQLKIKNDDFYKNIYLQDYENKSETFITVTSNKIFDIKWDNESNYVFIITKNDKNKIKKDELFIIDSNNKTVVRKIEGIGFNNLLVRGNFLFYDVIINNINSIVIYDIESQKEYDIINSYGGCSIFTSPKELK